MRKVGRMKRFLFLGVGSALMFTMGGVGPAQADNGPHVFAGETGPITGVAIGTDGCAACHRVHTAQSADGYLLKTANQADLCYTCHGNGAGGASTNVQGGVGYGGSARTAGTAAALRGGGFDKALINSGSAGVSADYAVGDYGLRPTNQSIKALAATAGQATTSNHSIDSSPQVMWGNGAVSLATPIPGKGGVTLACGSCHDPHGNGNYRILKPVPDGADKASATGIIPVVAASAVVGVNIPDQTVTPAMRVAPVGTGTVTGPVVGGKAYTTADYWQTVAPGVPALSGKTGLPLGNDAKGVALSPDGFIANISDWCLTCHTRYLGAGRSTNTGDAIFTYRHTTNKIDSNGTRNCITCHVAHGSNADMTGAGSQPELPGGTAAPAGDSRLLRVDNRGVCLLCHNV